MQESRCVDLGVSSPRSSAPLRLRLRLKNLFAIDPCAGRVFTSYIQNRSSYGCRNLERQAKIMFGGCISRVCRDRGVCDPTRTGSAYASTFQILVANPACSPCIV